MTRSQPSADEPARDDAPPTDPVPLRVRPPVERRPVAPGSVAPPAVETPPRGPAPPAGGEPGHGEQATVRRSRFGGLWIGLIVAAVLLVLLLIFILQNSQNVRVEYFGLAGRLPLAVAILLGVAAGALLVAVPGTVRILQLRKTIRRR